MAHRDFSSLDAFRRAGGKGFGAGPAALVIVEDTAELRATFDHLAAGGFAGITAFAPADIALPDHPLVTRVTMDTRRPDAACDAVNATLRIAPAGTWLHYCYNAEFIMHPFCESRSVGEMLAFHAEERRDAMLTFVVDLYAGDLGTHPCGVDRTGALFDRIGYYALARKRRMADGHAPERQLDFFGGLRWRFEEHVAPARRRIDRIGLFRARPGLHLRPDHTFDAEEYNTYSCQWHHNLTSVIASFRAAKALRANPISRDEIETFTWEGSEPFRWDSRQLMDAGLMEPGQWF